VSTTNELLGRKSCGSGLQCREYGCRCHSDHVTPPIRKKLALASPTSGGLWPRRSFFFFWKCSVRFSAGTPTVLNEGFRASDRRLSAKLVPTSADKGVSHGQCGVSLRP
jgi:hypothetical protein